MNLAHTQTASAPQPPPGPRSPRPIFGFLPEVRADKLGFFANTSREFGGVVKIPIVIDMYVVTDPDGLKHVLQDNHLNYTKGFNYRRMRRFLGNGLLTSEGEEWKKNRRLAAPAFHKQRIAGFFDVMVKHTEQLLGEWAGHPAGRPLDAHASMMALTLRVVGEALFSSDVTSQTHEVGEALTTVLEVTNEWFEQIVVPPTWVPTPQNVRFNRAMWVLDTLVTRLLAQRRESQAQHHDLLAMLMEARTEDGTEGMNDRQLRDEVMSMVLAGHETTANALTWALYLLSTHPQVERKLVQELTAQLQGRAPTFEDLPKLTYTKQVIEETMRLYPPAWAVGRTALNDDEICGYFVPKGAQVMLFNWFTHRDPTHWPNPEGFDPERFAPSAPARHRFAFSPFAAGPRMCIGNAFAMMEMQLVLAMVVQRFRVDVAPGQVVVPHPSVTLRPQDGLPVTLTTRSP
jgi:cytochrome P450